jgi:predicted nucleotidyltransferase
MRFGLSEATIDLVIGVLQSYPEVEKAILYGSRATGTFKNGSDIDLTLQGQKLTGDTVAKIANDLDDLPIPYTMDISNFATLDNEDLRIQIQKSGLPFYSAKSPTS